MAGVARTKTGWWLWAMALAMVAALFYPTLAWLVANWRGDPYYQHGALVPIVSLFVAWRLHRESELSESPRQSADRSFSVGLVMVVLGITAHLVALPRQRYLISSLALVLVLAGIVCAWAGDGTLRRQAFPLLFLLLMIPLPWLEQSTPYLARWVAAASATLARLVGVDVMVTGARLELPLTSLVVGAPCSGVSSLAALMTLAVLYAFVVRGPLLCRAILVVLALPLALLSNLIRVWLLIVLADVFGEAIAMGYFHDWSSPLLFLLALGLLVVVGKGLGCSGLRTDISL